MAHITFLPSSDGDEGLRVNSVATLVRVGPATHHPPHHLPYVGFQPSSLCAEWHPETRRAATSGRPWAALEVVAREEVGAKVRRCRFTLSNPALNSPLVSVLEATV